MLGSLCVPQEELALACSWCLPWNSTSSAAVASQQYSMRGLSTAAWKPVDVRTRQLAEQIACSLPYIGEQNKKSIAAEPYHDYYIQKQDVALD